MQPFYTQPHHDIVGGWKDKRMDVYDKREGVKIGHERTPEPHLQIFEEEVRRGVDVRFVLGI